MGGVRSRRGVYYDLSKSPYEFKSPYGDLFKFSSAKKLEIYTRDIQKELEKTDAFFKRHTLYELLPVEIVDMIKRRIYRALYDRMKK